VHRVRSRTGRLTRVPVAAKTRKVHVRFRYAGRVRSVTVRLRRR
jgi:hypothetical protein